ncbi:unnamed protein product [Vitrella brassicaformis CCMP3155]|uniref:Uncharacterized protein n=1 Tax=Vitrella brassicaformis (strain CCMP3155) TaxID=1169540 RepID=A0A0G4ETE5_VITBC|nr:unnamed protein product [Vitrella brassicaformis CCMP3155]|eukprot:CEM01879.1 unnamed protein product [Vitrella brassicaformis CCMP3155]
MLSVTCPGASDASVKGAASSSGGLSSLSTKTQTGSNGSDGRDKDDSKNDGIKNVKKNAIAKKSKMSKTTRKTKRTGKMTCFEQSKAADQPYKADLARKVAAFEAAHVRLSEEDFAADLALIETGAGAAEWFD